MSYQVLQKFPSRVQKNIKALRNEKLLFDFTIHIGDKTFQVHKFLLASYSDYFKAMFVHDSIESQQNKVHLQEVSVTAMEAILEFCYSSQISLNVENVQEILIAASIMQIDEIQSHCVEYIQERIDTSNCLGILMIADQCNLPQLSHVALNYCLDKFETIIEENEYLSLDEFWLSQIISNSQLNVSSEDKVFQAVIKWIADAPELRENKLETLLPHIRLSLIEPVTLVSLSTNELVRKSMTCRDLIDEAKNFQLLRDHPEKRSQMLGIRFQPRISQRSLQRIFAVGGWTNELKPIESMEKYDPYGDVWVEVSPMTRPRCGVGATILGDNLYAVGGHDGTSYLKSAERYEIMSDTWFTDVADMKSERTSVGVVSLKGYIYAIGGQTGTGSSAQVERYNKETNEWEECEPLLERRLGAGVTVLDGLIYVIGGANQSALDSVECYNPITGKWTLKTSMTTSRKHLGCASYAGKIYAVGGRCGTSELETAECYDPESDTWEPIASMSEKRSGIGLVEVDNLLYAVGGHNGDNRLRLVEVYDPVEDKWSKRKPMIYERLGGGLAVHSLMTRTSYQLAGSSDKCKPQVA